MLEVVLFLIALFLVIVLWPILWRLVVVALGLVTIFVLFAMAA